jgi:hypothetical protein
MVDDPSHPESLWRGVGISTGLVRVDRPRKKETVNLDMGEMGDAKDMPSTNGRREITARANAKEGENVRQAQKLASKTNQLSTSNDEKKLLQSKGVSKGRPRKLKA